MAPVRDRNRRRRQHRNAERPGLSRARAVRGRRAVRPTSRRARTARAGVVGRPTATPRSTTCSPTTTSTRSRSSARRRCTRTTCSRRSPPGSTCRARSRSRTASPTDAEWLDAARAAGLMFRVTEQCCHYPPLEKARALIRSGAIGQPTVVRIKTVVGRTDSTFQAELDPAGYVWRFNEESPGGHLFDDVMHKYAMALWLVDEDIRSVQAVVRQGPLFFEAPTVALWEYARHDLLGMMEVSYAPDMYIRSHAVRRRRVLRDPGNARLHLGDAAVRQPARPPAGRALRGGRSAHVVRGLDASYDRFVPPGRRALRRRAARPVRSPDLGSETAIKALQLAFAVYQASNDAPPVDPASIDGAVSPERLAARRREAQAATSRRWWRGEAARAERLGSDAGRDAPSRARNCSGAPARKGSGAPHRRGRYRVACLTSGRACP